MGRLILVTGGARSGKSRFAEKLAESGQGAIVYIATAEIWDSEMEERVRLHRERRTERWHTLEAPYEADTAFEKISGRSEMVLFDCLTVYLSNLLLQRMASKPEECREVRRQSIHSSMERLLTEAQSFSGTVIFVTNEVGDGIVPDNALAREFRDLAGLVNQQFATAAEEVYLVVCGIPVRIKPGSHHLEGTQ